MCGIVGFTGKQQAAPILLDGLSKLEYRGYDSAGLAVRDGENLAEVVKAKGRLSNLSEKIDGGNALKGTCGIGHTRWATHGEPSIKNAHPHVSGNCTFSLRSLISSTPLLEAASISIISKLLGAESALHTSHTSHGEPSSLGCKQLIALAKILAVVVLPVPLVPVNK